MAGNHEEEREIKFLWTICYPIQVVPDGIIKEQTTNRTRMALSRVHTSKTEQSPLITIKQTPCETYHCCTVRLGPHLTVAVLMSVMWNVNHNLTNPTLSVM